MLDVTLRTSWTPLARASLAVDAAALGRARVEVADDRRRRARGARREVAARPLHAAALIVRRAHRVDRARCKTFERMSVSVKRLAS